MKETDRYLKIVEWSEEDNCYIGTCPGLMFGGVHGDNEAKVYEELCSAVAEAVELYRADENPLPPETANKQFSGRFVLRIGKDLHRQIAIKALRAGESLNNYCQKILQQAVAMK